MKKLCLCVALCLSLISVSAQASEMDVLVALLVKKGILNAQEAAQIRNEVQSITEEKQQIAEKTESKPTWAERIQLKGDLRLRYQWEDRENRSQERNRARIRYRMGVKTEINDQVEVAAGLATGTSNAGTRESDPRSTNQTLGNSFSTKNIWLDYAYAKYQPWDSFSATAGKFKRNFYAASDLLWDSDLRFEGLGLNSSWKLSDTYKHGLHGGVYVLDEQSNADDPLMYVAQYKGEWKISDGFDLTMAHTGHFFSDTVGATLDFSSGTNTTAGGSQVFSNNSYALSTELAFQPESFPRLALLGDYVISTDPSTNNEGYLVGFKVGDKKVKKKGQWQFYYNYRVLEADAFLDIFPDSDAYGGVTDMEGHEVVFKYGLSKNISLALDYYNTDRIDAASDREQLLQVDLVLKF